MVTNRLFNELYSRHYEPFVQFADSYVRDLTVAEDITTDSFMAFWENRSQLADDVNYPAYILTSIKNKCLNHLKKEVNKQKAIKHLADIYEWELKTKISNLEACNPEELFTEEIKTLLANAVATLPETTQKIFLLNHEEQLKHKEIAEEMKMTIKGVEYHLAKAHKSIRLLLSKHYLAILYFIMFYEK